MKASAMSYAVVFTLIISLFCAAFIFLAAGEKRLSTIQQNKETTLFNLFSIRKYALLKDELPNDFELIELNNDSCWVKESLWGAFHIVYLKSKKRNFQLEKQMLIGRKVEKTLPTLYLADNNQALKLTGKTLIRGIVYLPSKGVDRAYVEGKNFEGKELINGTKKKAEKTLPKLKESIRNFSLESYVSSLEYRILEQLPEDTTFAFSNTTNYFRSPQAIYLHGVKLSGNLIIQSDDSIIVSNNVSLENVILISPVVRFKEDFSGCVQVFSSERITLEQNVKLNYPSSLFLNDENKSLKRLTNVFIELDENATLLGGILLTSDSPDYRNPVQLKIGEKATVVGLIYNEGNTELKSTVIGSLFTKNFFLQTKSSSYGNYLIDATIDNSILPDYFVYPDWLKEKNTTRQILKWL